MNEAMGLASFTTVVGPSKPDGLMIQNQVDKDLKYNRISFSRTIDKDSKRLEIDDNGKVDLKDNSDLEESFQSIYQMKTVDEDKVNELIKEASLPYEERPVHDKNYIYELLTNHKLLTEDQLDYDPLLEKVYLDKISKTLQNDIGTLKGDIYSIENKEKKDGFYTPDTTHPYNGDYDEEDASVKFPMLENTESDYINHIKNNISSRINQILGEEDEEIE